MDACCVLQTVCWINGEPRADLVRCFGTKHQRVVRSTAPHLSPSLAMRAVTSRVAMRRKRRREDLVCSPRETCECTLNECVAALKWTKQVQRAATVAQMGPDERVTLHSRDTV